MPEVKVGENESIESALKRFKKKIQKAGILSEIKRRETYEKPSIKRKRKSEAARKRRVQVLDRYKKALEFFQEPFLIDLLFFKQQVQDLLKYCRLF